MSSSDTMNHDEAISQFCSVTGADEERAKALLVACDWNIEFAINMHVDTDDGRGNRTTSSSAAGPSTSGTGGGSSAPTGEAAPVVTIDDSFDEIEGNTNRSSRAQQTAKKANITPLSNMYEDDVRPPIPPVRQVLVTHPTSFASEHHMPQRGRYNTRAGTSTSDVYDAFRDFQAEAQWQEMVQEGESSTSATTSNNVYSNNDGFATIANKRRTLQELFRPPLDLMFRGPFTSARDNGKEQNKWLLVNIQNGREFACQILNRDVWSNQTVKDILKEHFIFWQVYHDSFEGSRYLQFYKVTSFPHVSIVDPRTEFLTEHSSPDGSDKDASTMKKLRIKEEDAAASASRTLYDQSEEAQLEAAIKASLMESENSDSSNKAYIDEDSYTDAIESDASQTQSSFPQRMVDTTSANTVKATATSSSNSASSMSIASKTTTNKTQSNINGQDAAVICDARENLERDLGKSDKPSETVVEDYTKYLGKDDQQSSDLIVRFPDGTRDQLKFPSDSLMKALFLLLTSRGYDMDQYNYVTNFPRRLLHELPDTDTLLDAKLIRETIFVERRTKSDS